ncbi:hypothetical protein BHM03_00012154 [Ensete ventricosum]|nr:hypothetical protein BHM03_00012154 [Ensete ventricosum]
MCPGLNRRSIFRSLCRGGGAGWAHGSCRPQKRWVSSGFVDGEGKPALPRVRIFLRKFRAREWSGAVVGYVGVARQLLHGPPPRS